MFYFEEIIGKKVLKSDILKKAEHFFTTRKSVLSSRDLPKLEAECVSNLAEMKAYLDVAEIISPVQTHSSNVKTAKKGKNFPDTDALILEDKDIAILLNFADCTPIILYDEENNIGAVAHGGWRGTAGAIVQKTIQKMSELYETKPENVTAIIGPAISMKNYQVDEPVFKQVSNTLKGQYSDWYIYDKNTDKYNLDLKTVNFYQLRELGVERIDKCNYCTYDSNDIFFSYRKENGKTARHSAVLKLK